MEKKILKYLSRLDSNAPIVLCSIADQSGSTPRKDFPIMIVKKSGEAIGTIGGGKLEYHIINKAKSVIKESRSVLMRYLMNGKDVQGDSGICGGEVSVLLEPFTQQHLQVFSEAANRSVTEAVWVVTTVDKPGPAPVVKWKVLSKEPKHGKNLPMSFSVRRETGFKIYRYIPAASRLHIFGAGHVGMALAGLADFLDYSVFVYDDRPELMTKTRYPHVVKRVLGPIPRVLKNIELLPTDFVIVSTRNHTQDLNLMRRLTQEKVGYLGLVSSRRKWLLIKKALEDEGIPADKMLSVFAPTGLDIGSETVPEIALSIMSEIVYHQKRRGRSVISLTRIRGSDDNRNLPTV